LPLPLRSEASRKDTLGAVGAEVRARSPKID
jgi:hypothetical protein